MTDIEVRKATEEEMDAYYKGKKSLFVVTDVYEDGWMAVKLMPSPEVL